MSLVIAGYVEVELTMMYLYFTVVGMCEVVGLCLHLVMIKIAAAMLQLPAAKPGRH